MNRKIIEKYIQFAIDNGMEFLVKEKIGIGPFFHTFFVKADNFTLTDNTNIKVEYNKSIIDKDRCYAYNDTIGTDYINIIELITSKEFIEAIARGLWGLEDEIEITFDNVTRTYNKYDGRTNDDGSLGEIEELVIKEITHNQADAIRDGKLEEFIENLLK